MKTENNNNILFVGAKIYETSIFYKSIKQIITIERVTKTQAIAQGGKYKFNIKISESGDVKRISDDTIYTAGNYYLENPELKEQFWREQTVRKLVETNYKKLSTKDLGKILSIIENSNIDN